MVCLVRVAQLRAFLQCGCRRAFAEDRDAALEGPDRVRRVLVEVVAEEDRVDPAVEQLVITIAYGGLGFAHSQHGVDLFPLPVEDRGKLGVFRFVEDGNERGTAGQPEDSDFDFFHVCLPDDRSPVRSPYA